VVAAGALACSGESSNDGSTHPGTTSQPLPCPDEIVNNACYQAYVQALADLQTCFGHTDTCKSDGDPTGCGSAKSTSAEDLLNCTWADGAKTQFIESTTPYELIWRNGDGVECGRWVGVTTLVMADGSTFYQDLSDLSVGVVLRCSSGDSFTYPKPVGDETYACTMAALAGGPGCCLAPSETCADWDG